jgi:tRNA(adenine34) deaminase
MTSLEERASWIGLALLEARAAGEAGEVPVGAVVVDPLGEVVGAARNRREEAPDPTAHAEILALRKAASLLSSWRLDGCILVSTLEPCPMCAGAAIAARVRSVVFGAWDPKLGAAGSVWDLLRDGRLNHRLEVFGGVREADCRELLDGFFADLR